MTAPQPDLAPAWVPTERNGHVRIGLSARQQVRWALLTAGVTAVVVAVAVLVAQPLLVLAGGVLAAWSLGYVFFAGVELTPATLTMFGPSLRRRTWWTRTVRWSTILDIQTTLNGEVWLALPGEPPLVLRAPRGQWVVPDPDFDLKVSVLVAWWVLHRGAPARAGEGSPLEQVQRRLATGTGPQFPPLPARETVVAEPGPIDRPEVAPQAAAARPASVDAGPPVRTVPEPELVEGLAALDDHAPFPIVALVGFFLLALVVGYLLVGRDVIVLAIALVVLLRFGRDPGRPLALGAFVLLVLSAVATVAQGNPTTVNLAYATRRTVAAQASAIVGVFLVVSLVIFAVTERSGEPAPSRRGRRSVDRVHLATLRRVAFPWVRAVFPYVVVALAGLAVRAVGSPGALPPAYNPLLANLRLGTGYSLAAPSGGIATGQYPPLAPVLVAYSPLGPKFALLLISTATVVAVGWAAHRRWGRAAGIMAAAVAAVLPSLWGAQLPVQLAGLGVLAGVAYADPRRVTPARAAGAGLCLGLAALARPDSLVAVVVVGVWIARQTRGDRRSVLALGGGALAALMPWLTFVWSEFRSPWPMATLAATLNDPATVHRLPGPVAVATSAVFVGGAVIALYQSRHRSDALLPFFALPAAAVALAATDPLHRDLLTWAGPVAAVAIGWWVAQVVRSLFGPVLEVPYGEVRDWDVVFAEEQARTGTEDWVADAPTPIAPEPDEDRLFL